MRLSSTKSLQAGMKLAKTIYNERGVALVQPGIGLTTKMIDHLIRQNIRFVYISDERTDDIIADPIITDELRIDAIETIKRTFTYFEETSALEKSFIHEGKTAELQQLIDRLLMQMMKQQEEAISLLAELFMTDDYTFQHSLNVTIYSLAIGMKLNYTPKELSLIGVGSLLHDVGKMFIDESILLKAGPLTSGEFEQMKRHAELGFNFIRQTTDLPSVVAHCAYQHHERIDGSGYPRALTEESIHPYAKIIAIADVFDAVTSDRVYREGMLPHEGLEILYAGASSKFDLALVDTFKKSVAVYPTGLTVTLTDKRTGVVARQNVNVCDRPVVRVLQHEYYILSEPYEVDLASTPNVLIASCHT